MRRRTTRHSLFYKLFNVLKDQKYFMLTQSCTHGIQWAGPGKKTYYLKIGVFANLTATTVFCLGFEEDWFFPLGLKSASSSFWRQTRQAADEWLLRAESLRWAGHNHYLVVGVCGGREAQYVVGDTPGVERSHTGSCFSCMERGCCRTQLQLLLGEYPQGMMKPSLIPVQTGSWREKEAKASTLTTESRFNFDRGKTCLIFLI